jgi:hypothetical protein
MYNKRVNLQKSLRGFGLSLIVCVAAITALSGCSMLSDLVEAKPQVTVLPSEEAPLLDEALDVDITRPMPTPTDEWDNWRAGRDEQFAVEMSGYLQDVGAAIGVDGLESPSDTYLEDGYVGVAPFGDYCIAAISFGNTEAELSLSILSRINFDVSILALPTSDYESLHRFADYYRDWCAIGGDWPGTPPGETELFEEETPLDQA